MNGNESGYETAGNGGGELAEDGREDPDILAEVRQPVAAPISHWQNPDPSLHKNRIRIQLIFELHCFFFLNIL